VTHGRDELFNGHLVKERKEGAIMTEEQHVREIMEDVGRGRDVGNKLVYHEPSRSFRPSSYFDDPRDSIVVTNEDKDLFLRRGVL